MARRATSVVSTVISVGALMLMCGSGTPVSAQVASPPAQGPAANDAKWEFEFHLGGAFGKQPTAGSPISTFPVGESFTVPVTLGSGRYASTWYFGDGAALINQIATSFFLTPRITPLDPVLKKASVDRKRGLNFGGRVSRRLTPRFSAELSVDSVAGTLNLSDTALSGIESTRASFAPVWNAIIATGGGVLFTNPSTSSTTALTDGTDSRQTSLTGAVNIALVPGRRVVPYLTAGGGVIFRSGDLPAATLTGNYQFRFLGLAPLNESDVVRVHFAAKDRAPVGVFGGGMKYALTPRQGLRVDLRVHVSPNSLDTLVDAQSNRVAGTPPFTIPSNTVPALVFSNTSATRTSLSGPAITDLKTFTGSGNEIQTSLTIGYFVRFPAVSMTRAASAARAPVPAFTGSKWEVEAHVGGGFGKLPTSGTPIAAFPTGEGFITGGRAGRYASTLYFGDGAVLINEIGAGFIGSAAAATRITPLDPVLTAAGLERKRGASVGVRLGRRLTRMFGAEFGIDTMAGSLNMTNAALSGIEATRASFAPMWNAILSTGPTFFLSRNVSSNAALTERADSRQTLLTGAATFELPSYGRITPYATAGGGVLLRSGGLPSATLTGNYQFRIVDIFPFNESDVVKVHFAAKDRVPVGLFGGGVKYALSGRHGLRADVRVHVSPSSVDTLVDARPNVVFGSPVTAIFSGTTPPLVLSNSSNPRSLLTGPAITDLKTFAGSGKEIQTSLTVGYFVRFPAVSVTRAASAPRAPAPALTGGKWEVEAHVGGGFGKQPTSGRPIGTFPLGESFTTTGLPRSSRYASTWYFGDGAALLNEIGAGFGGFVLTGTKVTPLDPVLTAASLERKRGVSVGGRLSRRLTRILSGEFGVESVAGSVNINETALAGIEATRASFTPMWNALLATGISLFQNPIVSSIATLSEKADSRQTLVTGAAIFELPISGRVIPYATVGGGVLIRSGDLPTATLTGNYQFRFGGLAPFNASDVVEVHFAAKDKAPVGLFGGGVKYALSARQGLRADVRVHISRNSLDTLVNARPSSVPGIPAFFINSATTPSLVFSNTPTVRANLSGPAITDLKTFTGSGREIQTNLTVGYFVRF